MTENQYKKLAEDFAKYADVYVRYHIFYPSMNRKVETTGRLKGIGVGCNAGKIILANLGYVYAIPFADVNFPKSNRNF